MRRKSLKTGLFAIVLACILAVVIEMYGGALPDRIQGAAQVIDGDSLEIGGRQIRLIGVDAPEFGQTCTKDGREIACGDDARRAFQTFVEDRIVDCRVKGEDRYERLLARCYLGEDDIAEFLVSSGWAIATDRYHSAEATARTARSGIWSMEFVDPAQWRERNGKPADRRGSWF